MDLLEFYAKLHKFVIEQNGPWMDEDSAQDVPLVESEIVEEPIPRAPTPTTRRANAAISTTLLS